MNDEAFNAADDATRDLARRDFIRTASTFGTAVAIGADAAGNCSSWNSR